MMEDERPAPDFKGTAEPGEWRARAPRPEAQGCTFTGSTTFLEPCIFTLIVQNRKQNASRRFQCVFLIDGKRCRKPQNKEWHVSFLHLKKFKKKKEVLRLLKKQASLSVQLELYPEVYDVMLRDGGLTRQT